MIERKYETIATKNIDLANGKIQINFNLDKISEGFTQNDMTLKDFNLKIELKIDGKYQGIKSFTKFEKPVDINGKLAFGKIGDQYLNQESTNIILAAKKEILSNSEFITFNTAKKLAEQKAIEIEMEYNATNKRIDNMMTLNEMSY